MNTELKIAELELALAEKHAMMLKMALELCRRDMLTAQADVDAKKAALEKLKEGATNA